MTACTNSLLTAAMLLVMAGCRNTTNSQVSPLGRSSLLSPLSPVQGTAPLSPIQPTSGFGSFGSPTRVPPPPTGSYNSQGNYGSASGFGAPTGNYAPNGSAPSGATLGSNGMTRGLTDLSPLSTGASYDSGVRQTGWIGDSPQGTTNFGSGTDPRLTPLAPSTPQTDPSMSPRAGGMQVIDLTRSPYPPGYVPPQNRPGVGSFPVSVPFPQTASLSSANQPQTDQRQFGQTSNSTFARSNNGFSDATSFSSSPIRTASRPTDDLFPSTEPFPVTSSGGENLQWRRPSPRF